MSAEGHASVCNCPCGCLNDVTTPEGQCCSTCEECRARSGTVMSFCAVVDD
jgi:hypothetical protein